MPHPNSKLSKVTTSKAVHMEYTKHKLQKILPLPLPVVGSFGAFGALRESRTSLIPCFLFRLLAGGVIIEFFPAVGLSQPLSNLPLLLREFLESERNMGTSRLDDGGRFVLFGSRCLS